VPVAARPDEAAIVAHSKDWSQKYPLFGQFVLDSDLPVMLNCAGWPAPAHPMVGGMIDDSKAPKILVVSGTHDPSTAHEWAAPFTEAIKNGTLISTENPGHGQYLSQEKPDGCLNTAVNDYLLDLKLPPPNVTCPIDG
jgi:pimeloyl-ACP methyl ester carboxylesterase